MKVKAMLDYLFADDEASQVTAADVKGWLKVPAEITEDDPIVLQCINTASLQVELYTGVSMVGRTVTVRLRNECGEIELPFGPVVELTEVKDVDGNVVDTANYTLKGLQFKTLDYVANDFTATYTVGFGTLPDEWKTYIAQQAAWIYENRGDDKEMRLAPALSINLKPKRRAWL